MRTGAPAAGMATAASTSAARRRPMRRSLTLAAAPGQVFSDTPRRYPDFSRVSPCAAAYDTLSTSAHGERLNAARPGRWPTADGRTPPRGLAPGTSGVEPFAVGR